MMKDGAHFPVSSILWLSRTFLSLPHCSLSPMATPSITDHSRGRLSEDLVPLAECVPCAPSPKTQSHFVPWARVGLGFWEVA